MKKTVFCLFLFLSGMISVASGQKKNDKGNIKGDTITVDSLEYRLVVIDPGFESWLVTKPSMNFYSIDYYEHRNRLYVQEWNLRYITQRDSGLYDTYIDYNPRTDYGLDLNYKLYNYFVYFEEKHHVKLINISR